MTRLSDKQESELMACLKGKVYIESPHIYVGEGQPIIACNLRLPFRRGGYNISPGWCRNFDDQGTVSWDSGWDNSWEFGILKDFPMMAD